MTRTAIETLVSKHIPFTDKLYELLKSILNESEIKYQVVEKRTKTVESLEDKIKRKEITNVEKEITDISGLRIILYYQDDVDKISKLIRGNFEVDENNSADKAKLYNSNEFGYLSIHHIVSLDDNRKNLTEWKKFSKLKAEIQVRTVLQHSWASISHEISYKKSYDIPDELQRKLFRLAGLFELADEQFLKIRDEHEQLKKSVKKISQSKQIESEKINLLTLTYRFEKKNSIFTVIERLAYTSGFKAYEEVNYEIQDNFLSEIIRASEMLGYNQINELENILRQQIRGIEYYFKQLILNVGTTWVGEKTFFNLLAIFYLFNDKQYGEFISKLDWSATAVERINHARKKIREEVKKGGGWI